MQIEKEILAVVYAVEKFNQYTYGRHVNIESDHKPLQVFIKKLLHSAPKRLEGMMLRLQKYDVHTLVRHFTHFCVLNYPHE